MNVFTTDHPLCADPPRPRKPSALAWILIVGLTLFPLALGAFYLINALEEPALTGFPRDSFSQLLLGALIDSILVAIVLVPLARLGARIFRLLWGKQSENTNVKLTNTILPLALAAGLLVGCNRDRTYPPSAVFNEHARLTETTENFVKVVVSLETDSVKLPIIRATFTPTQPGFHLYGKDMPENGINGLGRPTRLAIVSGAIKPAGPVFSDVTPHDSDGLPIYPDGAVTLRQPVEIIAGTDLTAQIEVSYMACKTGGECKAPVERKRLELKLPNG